VLDTWFSSALWPFSTIGWPEETPELKRYYPGDVLVTGFDIIFFWVARMMMMGLHFMKDVPFRTVYIHALVRDERGQKMAKFKGNVIDPLDLIDKYGCDALRFTLTAQAAQGRDIKFSETRVEGYRNFATKLWNAARYAQMNQCLPDPTFDPGKCSQTVNRWIVGRTKEAQRQVESALESYRFNDAAEALYHFAWGEFCDWYLEFTKPILSGGDAAAQKETRAATAWVLDQLLHLLHPFMPFITEELWGQNHAGADALISAPWPKHDGLKADEAAATELDWLIRAITAIRAVRSEMNVPPAAQLALQVRDAGAATQARLKTHRDLLMRLARLNAIDIATGAPSKGAVQVVADEATFMLPLAGVIDVAREQTRLQKELEKAGSEISKWTAKLGNEAFVAKAPPEVIEEQRERLAEATASRAKLAAALERLAAL
jgi:valyl-tRNA synthetase